MVKSKSRIPRISRGTVLKMERLLNMQYKPSEIAEELGISTKTIYSSYIPAGLPHQRDDAGNFWIVGTAFRDWAMAVLQTNKHVKKVIGDNEAYCVGCRAVREFSRITKRRKFSTDRVQIFGPCSVCGSTMVIMRKVKDDQ